MNKAKLALLLILMTPMIAFSHGDEMHVDDAQDQAVQAGTSATVAMSEGEIRRINKETGKVTIKHGPLQNLNMPAMTMLFVMQPSTMIDQIKEGDKIKFVADKIDGEFVAKSLQIEK